MLVRLELSLNRAFRKALTFAKRMRGAYRINDRPISIGLTAIKELDRLGWITALKGSCYRFWEGGQLVTKYAPQPFESAGCCSIGQSLFLTEGQYLPMAGMS